MALDALDDDDDRCAAWVGTAAAQRASEAARPARAAARARTLGRPMPHGRTNACLDGAYG